MCKILNKWEYFGYYGIEKRNEADIDSDNEPDEFNLINKMNKKLSYLRKQKTNVK